MGRIKHDDKLHPLIILLGVAGLAASVCLGLGSLEFWMYYNLIETKCVIDRQINQVSVCHENDGYYPRSAVNIYCYHAQDNSNINSKMEKRKDVVWCGSKVIGCGNTVEEINVILESRPVGSSYKCWYWKSETYIMYEFNHEEYLGLWIAGACFVLVDIIGFMIIGIIYYLRRRKRSLPDEPQELHPILVS